MSGQPPNPMHRASSSPSPDRQRSSREPSLQQFADNVRHVPPQGGARVQFVAEPEEILPYEPVEDGSSAHIPVVLPIDPRRRNFAYPQYSYPRPMPRDSAASSEYAWTSQDSRRRRPTKDYSISDRNWSYDRDKSEKSERSRVRFAGSSDRTYRSRYRSPSRSSSPSYRAYSDSGSGSDSNSDVEIRRAHYRSHRRSYVNESDSELSEEEKEEGFDELIGGKVFQFVPSRTSRALGKSGHSIDSDTSLDKPEYGVSGARDESNIPGSSDILHVFQSQYTGDAVSDGTHTAKLTVIHDPKKQRQPLFRWVHLEQRMMNLDELSTEIARIPAITDSERTGFAKLLAEVKKTSVKVRPTAKGNNVRHMDPKPIRVAIPPDGRTKGQTSRFVTWLCVPYFSLEKYSGLLSASTASSFPIETLLQSDYARTTQERDMQQAVCKNGEVPDGHCFHIAQLWCIVLDNTLLITCGQMTGSSLRGDLVSIAIEPLREAVGKGKKVYVSYYDSVLWELPLESCLTWFDFSIHFREFWPQAIRIYHHGRVLTKNDWPRIVNMVKNVNTRVILDLRLWIHPSPPAVGVLQPLRKESEGTKNEESTANNDENKKTQVKEIGNDDGKFHVFSWLEMDGNEGNGGVPDIEALTESLQETEDYLLQSTSMKDRNSYRNCKLSSRGYVHAYLKSQGLRIENLEEKGWQKNDYEQKVDLYNAADIVFSFFLPQYLGIDKPTIGRFWGAVDSLVQITEPDPNNESRKSSRRHAKAYTNVFPLRNALRGLTRVIQSFQDILSHMPASMRAKVEVPDSLVRAWLHLVMALIQASQNEEAWNENMNVAEALIRNGMNDITAVEVDELPTKDLLSSSVLQPMELVTLVSSKLLKDSTGKYSSINDTYSDYLKGLENEITANNSDRSHQFRITLFRQEVAVIRRVIASQLNVVDGMTVPQKPTWGDQTRRERKMLDEAREKLKPEAARIRSRSYEKQSPAYVDKLDGYESYYHNYNINNYPRSILGPPGAHFTPAGHPDTFSKLTSTDPGGFRELLGRECISWLERRDMEFLELEVEASRLEMMNANKIEVTKDRQEAAVYAFTMVTIIFLPLSTISSIFGMNSSDVRDMELGQWAYWAAALPTTLAVIILGLWWMGELHNLIDWVRGLPSRSNRSYARVSRPAANGVIYYPQGDYARRDPQQAMRPYSRATLGPPVPRTSWRY
ncbi:hypothetical protein K445DRAFT_23746 [Daldinia sp. EC12]|nr:hypothetical protein K445DRAFT_23746 [Daldinia sp. EC12]